MRVTLASFGLAALLAVPASGIVSTGAFAADDPPPGRYSMSPAEGGGFVRLDTRTGQMSLCERKDNQWMCRDMADQGRGLAEEVERLRTENRALKDEIKRLDDVAAESGHAPGTDRSDRADVPPGTTPAPGTTPGGDRPGRGFKLPSERDVGEAMDYAARLYKKFREKLKEFDSDRDGTPL